MVRRGIALGLSLLTACAGAGSDDKKTDGGGGGGGDGGDGGGNTGYDGDVANGFCSDPAKLIWTLEDDRRMAKFDPMTGNFTNVGYLNCPGGGGYFQPFSLALGRDANAWVLYRDNTDPNRAPVLFHVDTANGLACTPTSWAPQGNIKVFSMGFSTDTYEGFDDRMFIAGATTPTATTLTLATMDTTTYLQTTIGSVAGWLELSGNSKAELHSFVPVGSMPRIEKLDKTTGAATVTHNLPSLVGTHVAWAFATWGGDWWIFDQKGSDPATKIYQVDGTTGAIKNTIDTNSVGIPRTIIGAGVSTCAPVFLL